MATSEFQLTPDLHLSLISDNQSLMRLETEIMSC